MENNNKNNLEELSELSHEEKIDELPSYGEEEKDDDWYDDDDDILDEDQDKIVKATMIVIGIAAAIAIGAGIFFAFKASTKKPVIEPTKEPIVTVAPNKTETPDTDKPIIVPTKEPKPTKKPTVSESPKVLTADTLKEMSFTEVKKYLKDNKYNSVKYSMVYSDDVAKDKIVDVIPSRITSTDTDITIKVSLGKREPQSVEVPNFASKNITEVKDWATKNKIELTINETLHDYIETDKVISQDPENGKLKQGSKLTVTKSLGQISIGNFKDKAKADLDKWIEETNKNGAKIKAEYEFVNSSINKDHIVEISHADKKLTLNEVLKVKVSKGFQEVKNYTGQNINNLRTFAKEHNYKLEETFVYSSINKDVIISQNPSEGELAADGVIYVTVSKGSYSVPDLKGKSYEEAISIIDEANQNGANINVTRVEEESKDVKEGHIIKQDFDGTNLKLYVAIPAVEENIPTPEIDTIG